LAEALAPSDAPVHPNPLCYPIGADTTLSVVVRCAGGTDSSDGAD
jgi:hypothetical protein